MKTTFIISGLMLMLVMGSCKKDNHPNDRNNFMVSYIKGNAWVDYSYTAVIDQTGLLQITEVNGLTKTNRKATYFLNDSDILLIHDNLKALSAIDIQDEYGFDNENAPTDLPVTKLVYKTDDKSDSSSIYYPQENELPVQMDTFMKTMEQLLLKYDS